MKKINNRGFSLVELLAAIAILAILMTMAATAYNSYKKKARAQAYDTMAKAARDAAENYVMDNPTTKRVTFDELLEEQYIDTITDPRKQSQNCSGKVVIDKVESTDNKVLDNTKYTVNICCKKYSYTYSYPGGAKAEDEECKSALYSVDDITEIKVLNVYPNTSYANHLKNWMNTYGKYKGNQVIKVDPVYIDDFNANPSNYLGIPGAWKYDVIVFGFADSNNGKDLSVAASQATDEFLNRGHSAIFGHDTIMPGQTNFISLKDHVAIDIGSSSSYLHGEHLTIKKKGIFTQYPYNIGDVGTELTIKDTHVTNQIARGTVWITFKGESDPYKSIYLSTNGNNAFIQTGHTNGYATEDEQKIIANIIFYAKAVQLGL